MTPSIRKWSRGFATALALVLGAIAPPAIAATPLEQTPSPAFTCGGAVVIDERSYTTVEIGAQCWMSQNLDVALPGSSCFGAREANCAIHGRLYGPSQLPELDDHCPSGWRLATDEDWQELEVALGMSPEAAASTGWRREGGVEKQISTFISGGTNATGFSAFASGMRNYSSYMMQGEAAYFHAAGSRHVRAIRAPMSGMLRMADADISKFQFSARCVLPATR